MPWEEDLACRCWRWRRRRTCASAWKRVEAGRERGGVGDNARLRPERQTRGRGREGGSAAHAEEVLAGGGGVVGDGIGDVEIGGDGQQWPRWWR